MEPTLSGGEMAGKRAAPSAAGIEDDRLSALPTDILVLILLRLDTAAEAARTSVLSRRWRRVWALLPELRFPVCPEPRLIASALAAHDADLRFLLVRTADAAAEAVAAWLPLAAPRVPGRLVFQNLVEDDGGEEPGDAGAFELPCFGRATAVSLDLGFLSLALPPHAGVSARLTDLSLTRVRFHGPYQLGDAVSSPRCPCLQKLSVRHAHGLVNLAIHSHSLLRVELECLNGLEQLNIDTPTLNKLILGHCFLSHGHIPIANISAPQLVLLHWGDLYYPSSVQLGEMAQLQQLSAGIFVVYGYNDSAVNRSVMRLWERFQSLLHLCIVLAYPQVISNSEYLMEEITVLPRTIVLTLMVDHKYHGFGAASFHVLRLCAGIRRLSLQLFALTTSEAQSACPSGCICGQLTNWKTEELLLNNLEEVEIIGLKGLEHELAFVERLFSCATVLKRMEMTFEYPISESNAREFYRSVSSFRMPETRLKCYMYHDADKKSRYLLAPAEQGTRV